MTEINFHLGDCMDFMRGKPDNYYDLAVVDPPGVCFTQNQRDEVRPILAKSQGCLTT